MTEEQARHAIEKLSRSSVPQGNIGHTINQVANMQDFLGPHMRTLASFNEQLNRSILAVKPVIYADLTKNLASISVLSKLSLIPKAFEVLQAQNARWQSITASLDSLPSRLKIPDSAINQIARSALVWDSGISEAFNRLSGLGMLSQNPRLFGRLLEPSNALSKFTETTYSLMRVAANSRAVDALNASLVLADTQHLANMDVLTSFATTFTDDDDVSVPRDLTAPSVQQSEFLSLVDMDVEEDIDHLVAQSPAAQESERARSVLNLTMLCNKANNIKVKGLQHIFTPTTKLMEVFADLPWITPEDENTFGQFIDCLYFLIYEGAGKDNLRYLNKHGGPLADDDCEVVWCIKTLRNKWLRHDADHGKESDINKSWGNLNKYLNWLGQSDYPRTASDYRKLHRQLLKEMEDFLKKLLGAI